MLHDYWIDIIYINFSILSLVDIGTHTLLELLQIGPLLLDYADIWVYIDHLLPSFEESFPCLALSIQPLKEDVDLLELKVFKLCFVLSFCL